MQMTEELTRQIHAALEATGGSAARAAEFLGMEKRKLYDFIHNNADLKTRWSSSKSEADPGSEEAQSIHRPLLAVRQEAEEVADAVEREDRGGGGAAWRASVCGARRSMWAWRYSGT